MPSLKLAKRSAAFKAIKKLYDCGELSESLKPFDDQERLERYNDVYFKTWANAEFQNGMLKKMNEFQNIS